MRSRIIFFNQDGEPIEDISATTKRSWMLNDIGECSFTMNIRDSKLKKSVIEYGNYILVINPYTKRWVGRIDLPRVWTQAGPRITAYSAEVNFSYFQDMLIDTNTNIVRLPVKLTGNAGSIFAQIIDRANEQEDTLIRAGDIYGGGVSREETLKQDYFTHIKFVAGRSQNDFDVSPNLQENNTLLMTANWYQRKGTTLGEVVLEEGVNIQIMDEIASEQGIIKNNILAVGAGATDATRIGTIEIDEFSARRYGTRCGNVNYSTVKQIATLQANAEAYTAENAYPRFTSRVVCVDPDLYTKLNEGDIVNLKLHNAGFSSNDTIGINIMTRIIGIQAIDQNNTLELILDEYRGTYD